MLTIFQLLFMILKANCFRKVGSHYPVESITFKIILKKTVLRNHIFYCYVITTNSYISQCEEKVGNHMLVVYSF